MSIIHLVPGLGCRANGIAVAAKLIAEGQGAVAVDCSQANTVNIAPGDEVWVHSMWTPPVWRACRSALRSGAKLVRMTHGCLDPLRVNYHGWKKRLVAPIERWLFAKCDRVVVTGPWEEEWCRRWGVKGPFETVDLKRCFTFGEGKDAGGGNLLYLGRRHPLKGIDWLEAAVAAIDEARRPELRVVSEAFGEELERVWNWCDTLVLPTLSENFGLVVAEALARGKRVITTDGAPAWGGEGLKGLEGEEDIGVGYGGRLIYLRGYRDGTNERRVALLKRGIESCLSYPSYADGSASLSGGNR